MRGGNLGYPVAAVAFLLVCSLALTACASVQQPEATAPSADSSQPEASAPSADSSQPEAATPAKRPLGEGQQKLVGHVHIQISDAELICARMICLIFIARLLWNSYTS